MGESGAARPRRTARGVGESGGLSGVGKGELHHGRVDRGGWRIGEGTVGPLRVCCAETAGLPVSWNEEAKTEQTLLATDGHRRTRISKKKRLFYSCPSVAIHLLLVDLWSDSSASSN